MERRSWVPSARTVASGTWLAAASVVANGLSYVLTISAARLLSLPSFGELSAMLGVSLVALTPALVVQLVVVRRVSLGTRSLSPDFPGLVSASVAVGLASGALLVLGAPLLSVSLHLADLLPVLAVAATIPSMCAIGFGQGVLQGAERFAGLAWSLVAVAILRTGLGLAAALLVGTATAVLTGIAVAGLLVALPLGRAVGVRARHLMVRPDQQMIAEVAKASIGVAAMIALTVVDVVMARARLSPEASGIYAIGNIFTRIAYWLPQFVVMLALPRLSDANRRGPALAGSLGLIAVSGVAGIALAFAAPTWLIWLVSGESTPGLAAALGFFVLQGCLLAMTQVLLYSRLIQRDTSAGLLAWGTVGVIVAAVLAQPTPGLASVLLPTILATSALLVLTLARERRRHRTNPNRLLPAPGAPDT